MMIAARCWHHVCGLAVCYVCIVQYISVSHEVVNELAVVGTSIIYGITVYTCCGCCLFFFSFQVLKERWTV